MFHAYAVVSHKEVKGFCLFIDAWLYAVVDLKADCKIVGPDGEWKINSPTTN